MIYKRKNIGAYCEVKRKFLSLEVLYSMQKNNG